MSTSTPWGPSQSARQIAPGIVSHSTAGHGGIHLSPERLKAMPAGLRMVQTYSGSPQWFEEDADWALVALAFPESFTGQQIASAVSTVGPVKVDNYMAPASAWLAGPEGAGVRRLATEWVNANGGKYRVACSGSIPRRHEELAAKFQPADPFSRKHLGWALLRRIIDDAEAEALLFSDEEYQPGGIDLATIPAERIIRRPA